MAGRGSLTLITFFLMSNIIDESESKFRYVMRKLDCITSNKTIFNNCTCTFKTYKKQNFLSFRGTMHRRAPNMKFNTVTSRRNSDGYQPVLSFNNIEFCKMLQGADDTNAPYVSKFINFIIRNKSPASIMNMCNFIGNINLNNLTFSNMSVFEMYPEGDYIAHFHLFDKVDPNVLNLTLNFHLFK